MDLLFFTLVEFLWELLLLYQKVDFSNTEMCN